MPQSSPSKKGKWSKYKKRYNPKWEQEPELKNWISPASEQDIQDGKPQVYCKICERFIRAHHSDLIAHSKREKHKTKEDAMFGRQSPHSEQKYDYETEEEKFIEADADEDQIEAIAIELFGGDDPLLKRMKPEISNNEPMVLTPKINNPTSKRARHSCESPSVSHDVCEVHVTAPEKCKWQELAELKIVTVKEKRQQQRLQYNMNKAEFDLKMEIMSEEFKLKKRKLQLEILTLERNLKSNALKQQQNA